MPVERHPDPNDPTHPWRVPTIFITPRTTPCGGVVTEDSKSVLRGAVMVEYQSPSGGQILSPPYSKDEEQALYDAFRGETLVILRSVRERSREEPSQQANAPLPTD